MKKALHTFVKSKEARFGLLFALPAVLGFLIFTVGPMILSFFFSFTNYSGINVPQFVGLENYQVLFTTDPVFKKSLAATLNYIVISVPLNITFSFLIAFLLSQNIRGRGFFRVAYYMPTIVPLVATSIVWKWMLDPTFGIANFFLGKFGVPPARFLFDERTVIPSLAVMGIWQTGATMLIFLAGFQGIPRQLYEAVEVDGGNGWHKFRSVTVPLMTPSLFFNVVVGLINGFQVFTQAYIITSGGPNNKSKFIVLQLYEEAFSYSRMGRACAIAWVIFLIVLALTVVNFMLSHKWVYYESGDKA